MIIYDEFENVFKFQRDGDNDFVLESISIQVPRQQRDYFYFRFNYNLCFPHFQFLRLGFSRVF